MIHWCRFQCGCYPAASHEFLNKSTIFCDTVEPSFRFICVLPRSQKRSVPRARTIKGFRAQPPGKPVRMRIKTAAEVRTYVKKYINFLTRFWTLVRINLQTAAEVRTFVKEYVSFLMSLWTLARIDLQTAAEVRTFVNKYVNFLTSFWTGRRSLRYSCTEFSFYMWFLPCSLKRSVPRGQTDRQTDK